MATLKLAMIQSRLFWEDREANLKLFESYLGKLPTGTEIVLMPEMFSTGFSMNAAELAEKMDGPTVEWMRKMSAQYRVILAGSLIIEDPVPQEEGLPYVNRLIWMLPSGQLGIYDKRHLFAYGGEDLHYRAGNRRLIASVKGWRINLQVCYDLRFPVWARQNSGGDREPEYDILIYVANWPERRIEAWKTLLRARAIENQCYAIGVNRVGEDGTGIYHSGESMLVDPMGEVLYSRAHEEDVHIATLHREKLEEIRHRYPFLRDRDKFRIE